MHEITSTGRSPRARLHMRERAEQIALVRWCHLQSKVYPGVDRIIASVNGAFLQGDSRRRAAQWALLRQMGARKGVLDLFLPIPINGHSGLWIELKAPKPHASSVSLEQREEIGALRVSGYVAVVARGFHEARDAIISYYSGVGMSTTCRTSHKANHDA